MNFISNFRKLLCACVKMKLHEKLSPFLHIPILVKLVTVLVTATWIIFSIDIMIESNNVIVGVTTSGAVLNFVTNSYIFLTATRNSSLFIKYPLFALVLLSSELAVSICVLVLSVISRPIWETGGKPAWKNVQILSIQLVIVNAAELIGFTYYYYSRHADMRFIEKNNNKYCLQVTRRPVERNQSVIIQNIWQNWSNHLDSKFGIFDLGAVIQFILESIYS